MVLRLSVVAAALAACVPRPPVARLAEPAAVAVALVLEGDDSFEVSPAPEALRRSVADALGDRNLTPRDVAHDAFASSFANTRDTGRRIAALVELAGDAPLVVLVETRARYFSHLRGRYKWTVDARISIVDARSRSDVRITNVDFPAILDFDHEREVDAVAEVAPLIAEEVGVLVDRFLGGRKGFEPAATPPPAAGKEAFAPSTDAIYFVLVDRFANGDPSNDGAVDPGDPMAWHGGDIRGVIDRIDYLYDLGVRTVWLSPVSDGRDPTFEGLGAFHGYWVWDVADIEPRFGTVDEVRELSDALHARGMRLFLDVVLNHVDYDAPLVRDNPDWFHGNGAISDWSDPRQLTDFDVHGLPDLAQENDDVFNFLLVASQTWFDRVRPDGFRLDAVKHVPLSFWKRYNRAMHEYAGDDFVLLGEVFDGNPTTLASFAGEGGFDAVFDFPSHYAITESMCTGAPLAKLGANLFADRAYGDTELVTFLDNHDLPRIASTCRQHMPRILVAVSALLAIRGTPCINYGTEVALTGAEEPMNRGDMVFDPSHAPQPRLARAVDERMRTMLALRRSHPVLARGRTEILAARDELLVMLRTLPESAALVALHTGITPAELEMPEALAGVPAKNALTGHTLHGRTLMVPPQDVLVVALAAETAEQRAALRARYTRQPVQRTVEVRVSGAPRGQLAVVGLGQELGDWAATAGQRLRAEGIEHVARFDLPAGGVFEFKLVSGHEIWEQRDNRYLFVPPGDGSHPVHLVWGATG